MASDNPQSPDSIGRDTPVERLMTRTAARISPDATLIELAHKLSAVHAGALVVGTTGEVSGVVSERDLTRAYGLNQNPDALRVQDIASDEIIWCSPSDTATEAARSMHEANVRHLLVGDGSPTGLEGIISSRDLIGALI